MNFRFNIEFFLACRIRACVRTLGRIRMYVCVAVKDDIMLHWCTGVDSKMEGVFWNRM